MRVDLFDYELPVDRIAQEARPRGRSRLLLLDRHTGATAHRLFAELPAILRAGDLLVRNDVGVDVRATQLAKADLYAGTKLLMAHLDIDHVDRVLLAGAFGSFISPVHAMILGLIPDCDLEKVTAVGNAAGDGARFALLNRGLRVKAEELREWIEHISTPMEASFQDEFVAALNIPHAQDPFPILKDILPQRTEQKGRRHPNRIRDKLGASHLGA